MWALARHLGVPDVIVGKPPSADLVVGQTDEGDFGISYAKADEILNWLLSGYSADGSRRARLRRGGSGARAQARRATHWKRRLPTVAMLSPTAIGEIVSAAGGLLSALHPEERSDEGPHCTPAAYRRGGPHSLRSG